MHAQIPDQLPALPKTGRPYFVSVADDGTMQAFDLGDSSNEAQQLNTACIQEAITTFLSTRSIPLTLLAFLRCSFGFSEEEKAQARAILDA